MAAWNITFQGEFYDKISRVYYPNATMVGIAFLSDVTIGGGPMPPGPGQPPGGGGGLPGYRPPVDPGYGYPERPVDPGYGYPRWPVDPGYGIPGPPYPVPPDPPPVDPPLPADPNIRWVWRPTPNVPGQQGVWLQAYVPVQGVDPEPKA